MTTVKEINHDLDIVASIAGDALTGLRDKAGDPIFWHATEIAGDLEQAGKSMVTVAVALLHDVLEDSDWDAKRLHQELVERSSKLSEQAKAIVLHVLILTRQQGKETYAEYIDRIKESSDIAKTVKIEDVKHHLKNSKYISESLVRRYTKALKTLTH